jgi:hypothetical protein
MKSWSMTIAPAMRQPQGFSLRMRARGGRRRLGRRGEVRFVGLGGIDHGGNAAELTSWEYDHGGNAEESDPILMSPLAIS